MTHYKLSRSWLTRQEKNKTNKHQGFEKTKREKKKKKIQKSAHQERGDLCVDTIVVGERGLILTEERVFASDLKKFRKTAETACRHDVLRSKNKKKDNPVLNN
jgi:hypothetical protein